MNKIELTCGKCGLGFEFAESTRFDAIRDELERHWCRPPALRGNRTALKVDKR